MILTGAEIDQVTGLLSLREREPFAVCATAATLAALADNSMFGALAPDVVKRQVVVPGTPVALAGGLQAELFIVPGKAPLYLEGENPQTAIETGANVGVELSAGSARICFIPGAAAVTPAVAERIARADVVFFDGTLFRDDEMIATGTGTKTGRRMGHMPIDGDDGSLAALADVAARRIYMHINNTNPILIEGSPERRHVERNGLGGRRGRHGDRAVKLMTPQELEAQLRDIGARRYHRLHPFHALLHGGKCTKGQVQAWALNRYYYQAMIPVKDASLIARCDDSALRREWRSRLVDHDGESEGDGGIARWLKLTDGLGLDRDYVISLRGAAAGDAICGRGLRALRARKDACWKRSRPRSPNCSRRRSSASGWTGC